MKAVQFGRTGLSVSPLCLGTMTFGGQADEATSHQILDTAFEAGVTFIDTADAYPQGADADGRGATEEIIGRWLRGRRNDVVLATKFWAPMSDRPWDRGGSRKHIMEAVDASLRRLQTDVIDLYQIHFFDNRTPLDETLTALDDVVRTGKVHYVGCSNYAAWQLARAIGRSEALDIVRYESVQPRYNLLFRNIERELLPLCEADDIAVIPYNPLAGGFLTGKHRGATAPTEGGRFTLPNAGERYRERYWADDKFDAVEAIARLAEDAGIPMTTLAVAWTMANPAVTAPIIGARRPEQLAASLAAVDITLDDDLMAALDAATRTYRVVDVDR